MRRWYATYELLIQFKSVVNPLKRGIPIGTLAVLFAGRQYAPTFLRVRFSWTLIGTAYQRRMNSSRYTRGRRTQRPHR